MSIQFISFGWKGITGNALPQDIANFLESGADEVIIKPLTKAKLLDLLQVFHP
jgi:CheY-like chemotaxis protein